MTVGLLIHPVFTQQAGIHRFTEGWLAELERCGTLQYHLLSPVPIHSRFPVTVLPMQWFKHTSLLRFIISFQKRRLPSLQWLIDPAHFTTVGWPHTGAKKAVVIHDLTAVNHPEWHPRFSGFFQRHFLLKSLASSQLVLVPSQATKAEVEAFYPAPLPFRLSVVTPGIDIPLPMGSALPYPYFLMVGANEPRKNQQRAIAAFTNSAADLGETRMVVVGPPGWRQSKDDFESSDRIVRLSYVSRAELMMLYRHALALVYPSLHEGFGFPPLEAMALGCPVIGSAAGALSETVTGAAAVVNPDSESEIAEAMKRMVSESAWRQQLVQRGLAHSQAFSWPQFVRRFESLLLSTSA